MTGLPIQTIECLRWRKIKRIAADVADTVRAAKAKHDARIEALARHDALLLEALHMDRSHLDRGGSDEGRAGV